MKRLIGLIICIFLFGITGFSYAETKLLSDDVLKDISLIPEKPHFLLGISQPQSKWDKFQEMRKMYRTAGVLYQPAGGSIIDRSAVEYRADTMLQETITVAGRKIQILYLGYHQTPEGMYVMYLKSGEKNLAEFSPLYEKYKTFWALGSFSDDQWKEIKKTMGWAQFEAVKSRIHKTIVEAAAENVAYYESFGFVKQIIKAREKILDDPDYEKKLDDSVPGLDGMRNRDVIAVPQVEIVDFLPDIFMVGLGRIVEGGATYWRVSGSEQIVYMGLQALIWEYIDGGYHVTRHEFTHNNPSLQNLFWGLYFDVETWCEMATGLLVADPLDFLYGPYLAHWRDLVKNHWGYDTEEVIRRLFPMYLGGPVGVRDISRKEFEENAAKAQEIADELKKFVEKLLVRSYTDSLLWSAVNTKFCDTAAALRLNFLLEYKSAGIFDPNKKDKSGKVIPPVVQTEEWLMREEERIKRLADEAMKNTGTKDKRWEGRSKLYAGQMKCPVDTKFFLLNQKEQDEVLTLVDSLLPRARAGDWAARKVLMRAFGNWENISSFNLKGTIEEEMPK